MFEPEYNHEYAQLLEFYIEMISEVRSFATSLAN
jgi:hypothetical protein